MDIGVKHIKTNFPKSISIYLKSFLLFYIFTLIMRLFFLFLNRNMLTADNKQYLLESLYVGTKFDLRLTALSTLPLFIILAIPTIDFFKNKFFTIMYKVFWSFSFVLIFIFYLADFSFYTHSKERLSLGILNFIDDPMALLNMFFNSSWFVWIAMSSILVVLFSLKLNSLFISQYQRTFQILSIWQRFSAILLIFVLMSFSAYGKLSKNPLQWSEAKFSNDAFISSFTSNPVLQIVNLMLYKKDI